MLNNKEIEQICNLTCDFDSLPQEKEFSSEYSFEKYYDTKLAVAVIDLYTKGKISAEGLGKWFNQYSVLICTEEEKATRTAKDFIKDCIYNKCL